MKYLEVAIPEEHGYLIPIGDVHFGDKGFKKVRDKLTGYLDWIMERPNAYTFLMGDIFNVAGRGTPTSPFESDSAEYERALYFFEPYKSRIIGAIDGNHEHNMYKEFGASPLSFFCRELDIPYCKYSAIVRFKVGKRKNSGNRYFQNYFGYFHHTTGGGRTVGGKLNRVAKLRDIVEGVDFLCGGHNHQLGTAPQDVYYPSMQGGIKRRRIWYVNCGSYMYWEDSYAEKAMLPPAKLGSPRIRMDGREEKHDVHISL